MAERDPGGFAATNLVSCFLPAAQKPDGHGAVREPQTSAGTANRDRADREPQTKAETVKRLTPRTARRPKPDDTQPSRNQKQRLIARTAIGP